MLAFDAVARLPADERNRLIAAGMLAQLPARVEAEASLSAGATPTATGAGPCWVRKALAQTDDEFVAHFDGFSAGLRERLRAGRKFGCARSRVFDLRARRVESSLICRLTRVFTFLRYADAPGGEPPELVPATGERCRAINAQRAKGISASSSPLGPGDAPSASGAAALVSRCSPARATVTVV